MSASLRERLGMMTGAELPPSLPAPPAEGSRIADQLHAAGWRQIAPHVYGRDGEIPVPEDLTSRGVGGHLLPAGCRLQECVFWDTETTGLAGAGTVIFLVGCGWVESDRDDRCTGSAGEPPSPGRGTVLRLHQVFLADFPGERRFLEHLSELFSRFQVFVSYNGRAFDCTILKTRLVMSGMTMALGYQLDLLYLARRFWRRLLADCRLTTIEQEVLGVQRGDDVPGWMVPEIYFDSLRRGVLGQLPAVFRHNAMDVVALARLLALVNEILAGNEQRVPPAGVDRAAVGWFLLQQGDRRGERMLRLAYQAGDEQAGLLLGGHLKRAGEWRDAVVVWQDLVHAHGSLDAAVELSKYYEHRVRDLEAALTWIVPHVARGAAGADLLHREARIRGKLRRSARNGRAVTP